MPGVSTIPFEAHPFTIASVDTSAHDGAGSSVTSITEKDSLDETKPYWKELVFFVNVHSGFTKNLCNAAEKGEKVKVFVDGPYGKSPDLKDYDTCVLIAGGSGVSFTLPLLLDGIRLVWPPYAPGTLSHNRIAGMLLLERAMLNGLFSSGRPETQVRNSSPPQRHSLISTVGNILWISETLEAAIRLAPFGLTVSIRIYLTSDSVFQKWDGSFSITSGKEDSEPQKIFSSLFENPAVQVTRGSRPNLKRELQEEADFTDGRMGVTGLFCRPSMHRFTSLTTLLIAMPTSVCGPQSITIAVKDALGFSIAGPSSIMKGGPSITLHTEAFGYA